MLRKFYYIVMLMLLAGFRLSAQNIRYVSKGGAYANDGKSWATAKINVQDAINDLVDNGLTGEVWVAAGTYTPTESTESSGGSTLYMSFKIPAGISVYGGFAGTETSKEQRAVTANTEMSWIYTNRTILSGDLSSQAEFTWNPSKKIWNTSFYGNCFHVVWFATNGFDAEGRALPLAGQALLEGCVVEDGNAQNTIISGRHHNAYGGGIYMVEGATVKNTLIRHCAASRDGGAVYMDGGGEMEHCYISESQTLGIGIQYGYGGGVCLEGNRSTKPFGLKGVTIANCVGRMGGGLAIKVSHAQAADNSDIRFKPYASAVLVANNTATTEAGGVYMLQGGAITQATIVNNQCNGTGITSNGMVTGRSAGVYCRDNGYVINSVLWGGECAANNDIQYATSRSANRQDLKAEMHYSSLSQADYVDWSGTRKVSVSSLSAYNDDAAETAAGVTSPASMGYPMFANPSTVKGYLEDGSAKLLFDYYFQPRAHSSLANAGLLPVDWDADGVLPFRGATFDIRLQQFHPRCTQGAYTVESVHIQPQSVGGTILNFYVDASYRVTEERLSVGDSWENPVRFLSNVMSHLTDNETAYAGKTVNVYVKEGVHNNTNSFVQDRIRMIGIRVPSNVNIYGGFPADLTGTDVSRRNPLDHPTIITGNVSENYDNNVAHLLIFSGSTNVLFDGFQVRNANASTSSFGNLYKDGAGMIFRGVANVQVRNTIIAGCSAENGAAIYADGNSRADFVNCIVHNNTSTTLKGIIHATGNSEITFNHCDFLRNVGYVGYIDESSGARQVYNNSIFFANMKEAVANTNEEAGGGIDKCLPSFAGKTAGVSGSYCFFDNRSAQFRDQFEGNDRGPWQYNLQYTFNQGSGEGYPRFINPTKNTGVSPGGDATFNGRATSFEPHNNNPIVNAANYVGAHTLWGTDISTVVTRDYGGLPDVGAVENHFSLVKVKENDYIDGQPAYGAVTYVRDYNTYTYDAQGNVTSTVTDLETSSPNGRVRDGLSWETAINGNATYTTSTAITSYQLATPAPSTIASPVKYKIGMLSGHVPGNTVYFAKYRTGNLMSSTTTAADGDDFILIATSTAGQYYIYNTTRSQYVRYTQTTQGSNTVQLVSTTTPDAVGNTRWRLFSVNATATYRTYLITPAATGAVNTSPSWNYYGGVNNNIGLWPGINDANGKWVFYSAYSTTLDEDVNGLQYAVNNAHELMKPAFVTRTSTQNESYSGGTVSTTHTYYDFTPTAENPQREVWVGAGIYSNPNGYQLRNHVKVYGAFPKTGNPGKDQRHPQLTTGVSLSVANQGITIHEYETILQTHSSLAAARASTHRNVSVLSHPLECRVTAGDTYNRPQSRVVYEGAEWDGFTLRYGYKTAVPGSGGDGGRRNGGAGLQLYENVVITNCVIRDNYMDGSDGRGAGVYVDGSTLVNCYIMNNTANCTREIFGGGLYMIKGTIYNSVVTGNDVGSNLASNMRQGAGVFVEAASFYNNTVVNNKNAGAVGVWTASAASAYLTVYNSIIMGGNNAMLDKNNSTPITFQNSFLQSTSARPTSNVTVNASLDYCGSDYSPDAYHPFAQTYADATQSYNYRLAQKDAKYNAVNVGTEYIGAGITLPDFDMDYTERVQDCQVDMGAFEFNGAFSISPDRTSVAGQAVFYVTPNGRGLSSATDPTNAACADKLQKVLDAAGRFKYNNPTERVIVKVANSAALAANNTPFKYYSTRTTDPLDQDVRVWSIIVPRGVEVWGGYTDTYSSANDNGFYLKSGAGYTDRRDITGHPTYFDAHYYNKQQKNDAYVYHVLTFTDKLFDLEGRPYMRGDVVGGYSSYNNVNGEFLSLSDRISDRAVVDGIFVTGGNANVQRTSGAAQTKDINQYGGAAIVTDFAHVRNCIVRNNKGIYGGALALMHKALVSGCLIDRNTAEYGGAIYVFEEGDMLSDGTMVTSAAPQGGRLDVNMPRVFTSTIVNNIANIQGGGIWFSQNNANVRVNSTVVWQNNSQDQANISGLTNPDKPADDTNSSIAYFPFSYSAAQNLRLAGSNNISLNGGNNLGVRFAKGSSGDGRTVAVETPATDFTKFSDFGYFGLTNYSVLVRTGMPVNEYENLKALGLSGADFKSVDRKVGEARSSIDIGARAIDKFIPQSTLMLRLYVARPEDIDMSAAEDMMQIPTNPGDADYNADRAYYGQEGSSFAYPMQNLQAALDYIRVQRTVKDDGRLTTPNANNLPFEICIARGTYYPTRDLSGRYGYSMENTFMLPEGVTLMGGFDCREAVDTDGTLVTNTPSATTKYFSGRYHVEGTIQEPDADPNVPYYIAGNVIPHGSDEVEVMVNGRIYKMMQQPLKTLAGARRHSDINANNIIEPWEFNSQTVLSGNVENIRNTGVLHVLSVYPDQSLTGALPKPSLDYSKRAGRYYPETDPLHGTTVHEEGQPITLDGLTVVGGYAHTYVPQAIGDNAKFNYYHGGGLLVDGKRFCDDYNRNTNEGTRYMYGNVSNAVAYRDIPVVITRCKFEDNHAGYGAAISGNNTLDIFNCAFEHNKAESGEDLNVDYNGSSYTVSYPGLGGAIYATHQVSAFNTIFANNEAYDAKMEANIQSFKSLRNQELSGVQGTSLLPNKVIGGSGGAVYVGRNGFFHFMNCNFVRNMANAYPAVFTMNPNRQPASVHAFTNEYSQLTNTVVWGNEVNKAMMAKHGANEYFKFASQLICNYGKPVRDGDGFYEPLFEGGKSPKDQAELDTYQETAWFSAYEQGRGITPKNKIDLRDIEYNPAVHVIPQLTDAAAAGGEDYQNSNIALSGVNEVEEGPNFVNPSSEAGYDGYAESADWSPARINNLTDNGSGKIDQRIYTVGGNFKAEFKKYADASEVPATRVPYSIETAGDYITAGAYTTTRYLRGYASYNSHLPLGEEQYMVSAYEYEPGKHQQLLRISYDPNPTHNQTYIDIGVYEYPHTELMAQTEGDEVDILWVSPVEKPDNGLPDGSAWSQPTSDLQRAIETLLASRNGHRKEIRLMNGTFAPIYNINGNSAFYINTLDMNAAASIPLNKDNQPQYGLGVKSLTIKGGYSRELNGVYDVDDYPAVIRQQNRTDGTSAKWDHLFYIADASQRVGLSSYHADNGFGWGDVSQPAQAAKVIPIQIDGVKLVNSQALPKTKGAAIYYADQQYDAETEVLEEAATPAFTAAGTTAVNLSDITYYTDASYAVESPVPTEFYQRTATTYYTDATYATVSETPTDFVKYGFHTNGNAAKLVISKTTVLGSGTHYDATTMDNYSSSAVYIGNHGGYALLYNNVMHSNYGEPLQSSSQTVVINNTFALNHGKVNITGGDAGNPSRIYNSVFWRNNHNGTDGYNEQFALTGYVDEVASGDIFRRNAFTGGNTLETDYSASGVVSANNYNVGLLDNNKDIINGPNFDDPENPNIEERKFTINPSLRLLNRGDNALYNDNLSAGYNVYDVSWLPTTRHDAASRSRFVASVDLGAYEYQNTLERLIYVNPNASIQGAGNSWADPMSFGNLQTAVDMAAIYHVNNPGEEAYVFVKGASIINPDLHTGETIIMRNGVSVFGGIKPSLTTDCQKVHLGGGVMGYEDATIASYIGFIQDVRSGIVGPTGSKTTVSGIKSVPQTNFEKGTGMMSLVDGFHVTATTAVNPQGVAAEPVVNVNPSEKEAPVALRNIVIHGTNTQEAGTDVAFIDGALLYEALLRDNTAAADRSVLRLGANAYAVNITAEGRSTGADGTVLYNSDTPQGHIYYSLVNYAGKPETEQTLSKHNYPVARANLNYQLTERSKHIDELEPVNPLAGLAGAAHLAQFINYDTDLDLLGNPRWLRNVSSANRLDRGAYETWRVDKPVVQTTAANHFRPNEGSVVYVMEGNSLVLNAALTPAYLLLKKGASLYGNNQSVHASYLAVEREMKASGSVVSMPFSMNYCADADAYANASIPVYDEVSGVLTLTNDGSQAYAYNGQRRSAWDYRFAKADSPAWDLLTTAVKPNQGVLYASSQDGIYRFTGKATATQDYVYTEEAGEYKKSVTLYQNDDRMSQGGADFTSKEDMGWNCIGLPYLVSEYETHATEPHTGTGRYNMDIPHTLWLYYDGVSSPDGAQPDGDGGFYSVPSWSDADWHLPTGEKAVVWVGEGIFTQTASVGAEEVLDFYRPVFTSGPSPAPSLKRIYRGSPLEEDVADGLQISTRGRTVTVTGLQGGESITIYDSSGRVCNTTRATAYSYHTSLPVRGIYVVRVDDVRRKVMLR